MKFRNIGLAVVGLAVFGFTFGIAPNAEAHTTPAPVAQTYVTVAWEMPKVPANSTSPTWPQKYYASAKTKTPSLNVLDGSLKCNVPYQVDVYVDDATTAALIKGKHLDAPNVPKESLAPGGWGTVYKLVYVKCSTTTPTATITTPKPSTTTPCPTSTKPTITPTPTPTASTTKPTTASSTPTKPASSSSQPTTSSSTPSVVTSQPVTSQPVSESTPPVVVHAELADTGSSITLWLILGAAFLVAAGAVVVAASRRKK